MNYYILKIRISGKDTKEYANKKYENKYPFFIVLCLITVSITCSVDVSASPVGISYEKNICYGIREEIIGGATFNISLPSKMLQGGKIVKIISSNKSVVEQSTITLGKYSFYFVTRKYGKTTFTITVKTAKNKNKKYKCNFSTVKYSNPFSSIQIGASGNLTSKFKKSDYYYYSRTVPFGQIPSSEKISIRPKVGWKLVSLTYSYYDQEKRRSIDKNIKNNTSIKYHYSSEPDGWWQTKDGSSIVIRMKNNKKGVQQTLRLGLNLLGFAG